MFYPVLVKMEVQRNRKFLLSFIDINEKPLLSNT